MAQRKWRNGENNQTLSLTLILTLTLTLFLALNLTLNDYFRRCAICVVPNTDSQQTQQTWPANDLLQSQTFTLQPTQLFLLFIEGHTFLMVKENQFLAFSWRKWNSLL